ncbi:MAG: ABC transporter substrate-binding protein [Candidatus Babeliales bacterium]
MLKKIILSSYLISAVSLFAKAPLFSDLERMTYAMPEIIHDAQLDWKNPNFKKFFERTAPGVFQKIAWLLHISQIPPWMSNDFIGLLEKVRLNHAVHDHLFGIEKAVMLELEKPTTLFVWGPLHGGWHSLIRTLRYLLNKNVIDEKLKIIKEDTYFIFMGGLADRSAYGLETLYTLSLLSAANPYNCLMLASMYEKEHNWHFETLGQQLEAYGLQKLEPSLADTFALLPMWLGITNNKKTKLALFCSRPVYEKYPIEKLIEQKADVLFFDESPVHTQGSILTGLDQREPIHGAPSWIITSTPTQVFEKYYQFQRDAFIEIQVAKKITDTKMRLIYNNDAARSTIDFKVGVWRDFFTGIKYHADKKKTIDKTFTVGSSLSLSHGVVTMSQNIQSGMNTAFIKQNERGGIGHTMLKLFILDDEYKPIKTMKNIETMISMKINSLLLPIGSPTLERYLPLVQSGKVSVFFPVTGGPQFRDEKNKHIIHLRASYVDEVIGLLHYIHSQRPEKKIAFFYQDDAFGIGPLEGAHAYLKKLGITDWVDVPYNRTTLDFKSAAEAIHKADPQIVAFFSISSATQELMRQLGSEFFLGKTLFGISFLAESAFRKFIQSQGINMLFAQVVPNPKMSTLQIVQEYRNQMDTKGYFYDVFSLEGYVGASLFIEAMKKTKPPFTDMAIMQTMETLFKNFTYKGLQLNFNPQTRALSHKVWIDIGNEADWIEVDTSTL